MGPEILSKSIAPNMQVIGVIGQLAQELIMSIEEELKRIAAGIKQVFQPEPLPVKVEDYQEQPFHWKKANGRLGEAFRRRMETFQ